MNWIAVEDGTPCVNSSQQSSDVLTFNIHGDMQVGFLLDGYWQNFNGSENIQSVTHWAELPEPPKK